jgi:hypothetical protein
MANDNEVDVRFRGDASEAIGETKRLGDTVEGTMAKMGSSMNVGSALSVAFGTVIAQVMTEVTARIGEMVSRAIHDYSNLGDAVEKAQRRIGGSAEYVSALKVSLDSVGIGMEQFQRVAQRLPQILEANGDKLKDAGVAYLDVNGKLLDSSTIIRNITEHMDKFSAGTERNTEGARLLGRAYKELADFTELTADRQKEATKVAEEFGLVMTEKDLNAANEFGRQMNLLGTAMDGFFVLVGKALTPALTSLAIVTRDGAGPAFEVFRGIVVVVMAAIEGLVWGIHLIWEVLGTATDTIHFAASALEALGYAMTFQFAKAAEVGKKAWEDYSVSVAERASSIAAHAEGIRSRMDGVMARPAAKGPDAASGDDPARPTGGDPVAAANAKAQLALVKQTLDEELAVIQAAHKQQETELSDFYDQKLSITLRGLQAEKENLAVQLSAVQAEKTRDTTREEGAQIEAKAIALKNQSLIVDMKMKDAVVTNEREKTEALAQEVAKRVDIEERAGARSLAAQQGIARDALSFQRSMGEISASEEMTAVAALDTAKFAAARESLERRLAVQRAGTTKYKEIQGELVVLDAERERAAIRAEENVTLAKTRELVKRRNEEIDSAALTARTRVEMEADALQAQVQLGDVSALEQVRTLQNLEDQKYAIQRQALESKRALYAEDSDAYNALTAQLEASAVTHTKEMSRLSHRATVEQMRDFKTMTDSMKSDMSSALSGMMQGTITWQKGLDMIWKGLTKSFADFISKKITDWLFGEMSLTTISKTWSAIRKMIYPEEAEVEIASKATGTAATTALTETATTTTIASKATEATAVVSSNAAEAGSGAAASVASIPLVGWLMAAGVFAAVLALVMGATGNIKSAEGGFDIPSGMNPMVQAHEEEMILPREHAETIRSLRDSGGGAGGPMSVKITAVDAKSVQRLFKNNGTALTNSLRKQVRNFRRIS